MSKYIRLEDLEKVVVTVQDMDSDRYKLYETEVVLWDVIRHLPFIELDDKEIKS